MFFLSLINQLKYFFIIFIVLISSSCRKDKEFVIKDEKKITQKEINLMKDIERALLIWKYKKNYSVLKKYLNAKEEYLKYSKDRKKDLLFLSEYYFYLSFISDKTEEKKYALNKGFTLSKENLELNSEEYKKKVEENLQDYQIIKFVNKSKANLLYWYINNFVFLKLEENNIILYKDDIEANFQFFYEISKIEKKVFAEIVYLYHLPEIAGGNKESSKSLLENINNDTKLFLLLKIIYFPEDKDKNKNIKLLKSKLNNSKFKDQIFIEILKNIKKY